VGSGAAAVQAPGSSSADTGAAAVWAVGSGAAGSSGAGSGGAGSGGAGSPGIHQHHLPATAPGGSKNRSGEREGMTAREMDKKIL